MATTMDIRLDYGSWAGGDEAESTESATSREGSLALHHEDQTHHFQQDNVRDNIQDNIQDSIRDNISRTYQSSALSLPDLFSDPEETVPDQDLLYAEMNTVPFANTSHIIHDPSDRVHGSEVSNNRSSDRPSPDDVPLVIDLTESPLQPIFRPNTSTAMAAATTPWGTSLPTLRSYNQPRRATPISSPLPRHTEEEHPPKRRRLSQRSAPTAESSQPGSNHGREVDAVDLTEVKDESDLSKAISKQQQDAVQSQMKDTQDGYSSGRTSLTSYKCPICMDTPEDATSTICGHLFCHKCIHDTLRFSQQQRRDDAGVSKAKGTCPVCRKPLARKDEPGIGRTLVPMEIKLSTRRELKGKGVVGRGDAGVSAVPPRMRLRAKTERERETTTRESSADMWRDLTTLEHG